MKDAHDDKKKPLDDGNKKYWEEANETCLEVFGAHPFNLLHYNLYEKFME